MKVESVIDSSVSWGLALHAAKLGSVPRISEDPGGLPGMQYHPPKKRKNEKTVQISEIPKQMKTAKGWVM